MSTADNRSEDEAAVPSAQPALTRGRRRTALLGAMFLMATSSIGPGFIAQTSVFTVQLGAAFAFAILVSVVVDVAIQLNVWRVLGVSQLRANELGNSVLPGLGWVMAAFIFVGGIIFNIGNIGGTGLGLNAMLGLDARIGGGLSALLAMLVFLSKRAGIALDRIVVGLGALMILLMLYVAISSAPPVGEALRNTVLPEQVDFLIITTLIGGTVGGYITFAGAHRLIDSGMSGPDHVREISRTSILAVVVTGVMRVLLFLAIFGVVAGGVTLAGSTIAADAFEAAAGEIGLRMFGIVLWAAGLSSVIGASYTSITFITRQTASRGLRSGLTVAFIAICAILFLVLDQAPQTLLIVAGAVNGLILPIGFAVVMWVVWRRRDLLQGYRYPMWLAILGALVWVLTIYLGLSSLSGIADLWQ